MAKSESKICEEPLNKIKEEHLDSQKTLISNNNMLPPDKNENDLKKEFTEIENISNSSKKEENPIDLNHIEKNEAIRSILTYFIQNIGRVRTSKINLEREKYINPNNNFHDLGLIFDLLMKKYIMSNKTKEEKIKYVLRKAFKFLGDKLKKEHEIAKNIKSKKEFDQIFNDYYMSSKKSLQNLKYFQIPPLENELKLLENSKFKLVFT